MQCSTKNTNTNLERNIAKRARFQGCNLHGLRPANVKQMIERSLCSQVSCFVKDRNWSDETDSRAFWIPGDILSEDLKGTTPAIGDERKLKEARRWRATGCELDESRRLQNHVRSEMDSRDKPEVCSNYTLALTLSRYVNALVGQLVYLRVMERMAQEPFRVCVEIVPALI